MKEPFKLLKISNENILLSRNFEALPKNFIDSIDNYMKKYLNVEEYENCIIVRDYIEYYNLKQIKTNSYVETGGNTEKLGQIP